LRIISEIGLFESELECISKIWDYYYGEIENHEYQQISISFLLIKLMEILKQTKNKALITNALLLAISFFSNIPPDSYNNRGIDMDTLSKKSRKKLLSQLRQEFC